MSAKKKTWFAILGLLSWAPMSGYDIKKFVEMGLSHFWNESYGQLYPTLDRLVREGLATRNEERHGKRSRYVFRITPKGRRAFRSWLDEATELPKNRNEYLLKFFLGSQRPVGESIRLVEEYRERQRDRYELFSASEPILSQAIGYGVMPPEIADVLGRDPADDEARAHQMLVFLLTLRHGIHTLEARLAWCDEALRALRTGRVASTHGKETT